jgi:hypothetical protein
MANRVGPEPGERDIFGDGDADLSSSGAAKRAVRKRISM